MLKRGLIATLQYIQRVIQVLTPRLLEAFLRIALNRWAIMRVMAFAQIGVRPLRACLKKKAGVFSGAWPPNK
jgi:hypothetical protein